jgi:hypothetical protein
MLTPEQELQAQFTTQFAALAHKHATVSYGLIGVLVVVLILAGVGGFIALKFADAQIARAEKQEQQYNADRKSWQDQLAASAAQRAAETTQQTAIVKIVDTRDKVADKAISAALKPGATAKQAADGLAASYSDLPAFGPVTALGDNIVQLSVPQAQQATASRIDQVRLQADLNDEVNLFTLEKAKTLSLSNDLASCTTLNTESGKVIAAYKKAAKASRLKKFLGGATKVAIFIGGVYFGHKL